VSALLAEASERDPAERATFLEAACADDPTLRAEVEGLLAMTSDAQRFFGALADEAVRPALAAIDDQGDAASRIGHTYGPYRVLEEIGRGGMGIVYKAEDTRLQRTAALKFVPRRALIDPRARLRLVDEARAASMLDDPNICTIYGVEDTPEGETFIAMAYYAGETLAERLARGPVPYAEALEIAVAIARGLAAAHARGVAHRDLTPRNVMLDAQGRVKILDFGLARAVGRKAHGVTAGTPAYMPPEQLRGEETGPSGDVWSLGVTLYELFTGRRPFAGHDTATVLAAVRDTEPPAPRAIVPRLPEALDKLLLRMLAKSPAQRPRTGAAVVAVLDPLRERHRQRRTRWLVGGVLAASAFVVAGAIAMGRRAEPPRSVPAVRVVLLPLERDSASPDAVYLAAGLQEALTAELSRVRGLGLITWTASRPGENTADARRRLADALGAAAVLEGEVIDQDSVQLRLHDGVDDRVLLVLGDAWRHRYPQGEGRRFAVAVATALGVRTVARDTALLARGPTATDPRTGHVYEAVTASLNWYDARDAAAARTWQGRRGHLAAITTPEENRFVRDALPVAVRGQYWLGGYKEARGSLDPYLWHWVTGEPFAWSNWSGGIANDHWGEDGVHFWDEGKTGRGGWNDIDRTAGWEPFVHGFVVEYPRIPLDSARIPAQARR
jgi:TolB-like protein